MTDHPAIQARDPDDVIACTCASLRRATRVVTRAYDEALRPSGLTASQFTVLATLAKRGALPVSRLAEALVMDRTTLTRNLKPLERDGLIAIKPDDDQRVRQVLLTAAGRRRYEEALPHWRQAQSKVLDGLGPERWSDFMDKLAQSVELFRR